MATENCLGKNRIASSYVVLGDSKISQEVRNLSNEIASIERQIIRETRPERILNLNAAKDAAQIRLESLTIAAILGEDFGIAQRASLLRKLRRGGGSTLRLANVLQGLDSLTARLNTDELNILTDVAGVGDQALLIKPSIQEVRQAIIQRLGSEQALRDRYGDSMASIINSIRGVDKVTIDSMTEKLKKNELFKQLSIYASDKEAEKYVNNYIIMKSILSPDGDFSVDELRGLISTLSTKKKAGDFTIRRSDINSIPDTSEGLLQLEKILFLYGDQLKNKELLPLVLDKLDKIKNGPNKQANRVMEKINRYREFLDDDKRLLNAIAKRNVYDRARSLGINIRGGESFMRGDILEFLDGTREQINWKDVNGDTITITKDEPWLAIKLLGADEIRRLGLEKNIIDNVTKVDPDLAAYILDGAGKKTKEQNKDTLDRVIGFINKYKSNAADRKLANRIISFTSNKNIDDIADVIYFDDTFRVRPEGFEYDRFDIYEAQYNNNTLLVGDINRAADTISGLKKQIDSMIEEGRTPNIVLRKKTSLNSDIRKLKREYGDKINVISPAGQLDINYILKDGKLYVGAKSPERLREITSIFESLGENIKPGKFQNHFSIEDAFNNWIEARYGKKTAGTYTKALREWYGDISATEANSKLSALGNQSNYYVEFLDTASKIAEIESLNNKLLLDEVDEIAKSLKLQLPSGQRSLNFDLDTAKKALYNFRYTPLEIGTRAAGSNSVANKNAALNYLLSIGGYKGPKDIDLNLAGQFNLRMQELGFQSPYDGLKEFLQKAQNDSIDSNDDYIRSFMKKYDKDINFLKLPGDSNFEKARGFLQSVYDQSREILGTSIDNVSFKYPVDPRGFALVDATDDLLSLRKDISTYFETFKTSKGLNIPNYDEIQNLYNNVLDDFQKEMTDAINRGDTYEQIDKIRDTYRIKISELEDNLIVKELGKFYSSYDKKDVLIGNKFNIFSIYSKRQIPDLQVSIQRMKDNFTDTVEETKNRVKSIQDGSAREKYNIIYTSDGINDVSIDVTDHALKQIDILPEGHRAKGFNEDNITRLNKTQRRELDDYVTGYNTLSSKVDGVVKRFYEQISPLLRRVGFFKNYRLIDTVNGAIPQAIDNMNLSSSVLGLKGYQPFEQSSKRNIFKKIADQIESGRRSSDTATNRNIIDNIVDSEINNNILKGNIELTEEQITLLKQGFSDAFSVYGELVPLNSNMIDRLQKRLPEVPSSVQDIVIPTSTSPTTTITTPADTSLSPYLGDIRQRPVESEVVPTPEQERFGQIFKDSYDYVMDFGNSVDELQARLNEGSFNRARPLYGRYARTNAIATANDILQGRGIIANLESSLDDVDRVGRNLLESFVDVRSIYRLFGKDQPLLGVDVPLLREAQNLLEQGNLMRLTDDQFAAIDRDSLTPAEKLAYNVADYFRNIRDVFNLSEDGSTGITMSASVNRDLYNMYKSFLRIGKEGNREVPENIIKDFYAFKSSVKNTNFFKFALNADPQDQFFAKYRNIIKNDGIGVSFQDGDITKEFVDEFNSLFQSGYSTDDVKTIASHIFGLRLANFMEGKFAEKVSDLFRVIALPISRTFVRFGYNVLSSISQVPSWLLRNQSIGANADELAKIRQIRRQEGLLGELADVSDAISYNAVDTVLKNADIKTGDDGFTKLSKLAKGLRKSFTTGKSERSWNWLLSQGNNIQEFLASAYTKDVALYRAMQENTYRPFTSVDEFNDFLRTAPVSERNKVLNAVAGYANKTYNDVMGMGFNAIDNVVAANEIQQVGKLIYESQSYMAGWGANVMKTLFDNIGRLFGQGGYVARNGFAPEAIFNAYQALRNSREFTDLAQTLYGDFRNLIRIVKLVRTGDDDGEITLEDVLSALDIVSVYFQAAQTLFKPLSAGLDSAADARQRIEDGEIGSRSDIYGLGGFTRSFLANLYRQLKFTETSLSLVESFVRDGMPGVMEELEKAFLSAADGSLKFMMGGSEDFGMQTERYSFGYLPALLAQKNNQNQDLAYMFQTMNDNTWNQLRAGNYWAAIKQGFMDSKVADFGESGWRILKTIGLYATADSPEEAANVLKDFYENVDEAVNAITSTDNFRRYQETGLDPVQNLIDADELIKELASVDGPGSSGVLDGLRNFRETGSYVYDGPEYWADDRYNALLQSIPKDRFESIYQTLNNTKSSKDRRFLSVQLLNDEVERLRSEGADQGRYAEWKALIQGGAIRANYDIADDGSRLTPAQKEARQLAYIASNEQNIARLDEKAYFNYVIKKAARDNAGDENLQTYMRFNKNKNRYEVPSNIKRAVEDITRFKEAIDEGNVDRAMAIFSPLTNYYNKYDTEQKVGFIDFLTQSLNYIYQNNDLSDDAKIELASELVGTNIAKINEDFDTIVNAVGPELEKSLEAFLGTVYNLEQDFTDRFRDTPTGGTASLKKLAEIKYDMSKFIDRYRSKAIEGKYGVMSQKGNNFDSITPPVMELIKLTRPPKLNAEKEKLDITILPKTTDKDINRRIKPRKQSKFKLPKKK